MTSDKDVFRLIRDNWAVVITIVSLIVGYVNLSSQVGHNAQAIVTLEAKDEAKTESITDMKIALKELQTVLIRIDRRTEFLDNVNKLTFE